MQQKYLYTAYFFTSWGRIMSHSQKLTSRWCRWSRRIKCSCSHGPASVLEPLSDLRQEAGPVRDTHSYSSWTQSCTLRKSHCASVLEYTKAEFKMSSPYLRNICFLMYFKRHFLYLQFTKIDHYIQMLRNYIGQSVNCNQMKPLNSQLHLK